MNTRNITEPTPTVAGGFYLEEIYKLQKDLLRGYIGIEGLPQYPIDVNSKKSQTLLKDFTGRVIEELAEGYESQLKIEQCARAYNYWYSSNIAPSEKSLVINNIQNLNEELGDALHFMVELLIYTNIQPSDIKTYIKKLKLNHAGFETEGDIVEMAMLAGRSLSVLPPTFRPGVGMYNLMLGIYGEDIKPNENIEDFRCMPGGWYAGEAYLRYLSELLWDITYSLNISRNCLKNKPWKQTGQLTDETAYQSLLVESFIKLMAYLSYLGLSSKQVYEVYWLKNQVNVFRQKSKY